MWSRFLAALILLGIGSGVLRAQSFGVSPNTISIVAISGVNHVPIQAPVTVASGYDLTKVTCSSDSTWVTGAINASAHTLGLTFATSQLVKRTYTATLTLTDGTTSVQVFVQATVSTLNLIALRSDPTRARVYGLHQDGTNAGALVIYDTAQQAYVGELTVGNKPGGLAISPTGGEMLVVCSASEQAYAVDLNALAVTKVINLPVYTDWGVTSTSAKIAYGAGNIIYYTDGAWAPVLHVLNRSTGTVLQSITISGATSTGSSSDFGFGDIGVSHDGKSLYGWAQYGWSAGNLNCYPAKFAINADGTLTFVTEPTTLTPALSRDPLTTPVLISADDKTVVIKQDVFSSANLAAVASTVPSQVYAMSPNAEVLATSTSVYNAANGVKLFDLPVTTTVQAISWDYTRLVYFNSQTSALAAIDLTGQLSTSSIGIGRTPADQSIVLAPAQLQWSGVPGVTQYSVYLGTSSAAVAAATKSSPQYLGDATGLSYSSLPALTAGTTYYWRVDLVTANGVTAGPVTRFTVSSVAPSVASISVSTVAVQKAYPVDVGLASTAAGRTWSATASGAWIGLSAASGTTPATLHVALDATQLKAGPNQGTITITAPEGSYAIPVSVQVDPLALTVIRSDPQSAKIYGISEVTTSTAVDRAYLLEIDSVLEQVTRVVPIGSSATDLTISHADNCVYVPNWKGGGVSAVDLGTFQVTHTVPTPAFDGVGYTTDDAFVVAAGVAGRLVTEGEDQWVDCNLYDTASGKKLGSVGQVRAGGGECDPTGRYYYHGDSDISEPFITKYDLTGDKFTQVAKGSASGADYYGSTNVVVSDDGSRIFWNGVAFDSSLNVLWAPADEIYTASANGEYAFAKSKIYDITLKQSIGAMPVATTVSAFNNFTNRLVLQNGTQLGFYTPIAGLGLLGAGLAPQNGAFVGTQPTLTWTAIPGIAAYQVYLGSSASAVAQATPSSAAYLGQVTSGSYPLPSALSPGQTYYWRVDLIQGGQVVGSQTQSFTVSLVVPAPTAVTAFTVQGFGGQTASIALASATAGLAWSASAADSWVKLGAASGTTPGTVQLTFDATQLTSGTYTSSVTVTGTWGSFAIPVTLTVDPLAVTVMRSDPQSAKVYAISEPGASTTSAATRAMLLEIDTTAQQITRAVPVGSSATDLAISHGDNRVYVPNWIPGGVLGVNLSSFLVDKKLTTPSFGGIGYSESDSYRISAGVAGRLITEGEDQWINVILYDTGAGASLASSNQREGGGQYDPTGRYYYHGDYNDSGAELHKLDTTADKFTEVANSGQGGNTGFGSRNIVVSEDGTRVYWNGRAFDNSLNLLWTIGDEIYATSKDGRYAFSATKVYDVTQKQTVYALPSSGAVSAFNTQTGTLVLPGAHGFSYYAFNPAAALPAPTLTVGAVTGTSVVLSWTSAALQTGFTLQMQAAGSSTWTDVASGLSPTLTTYTVTGLSPQTSYVFRIRADSPVNGSAWSATASAATPAGTGPASQITNFSIRSVSASGAQVLSVGFVVSAAGKPVLVRAVGPGLAAFGVGGLLPTPQLNLFAGSATVPFASDNGWSSQSNAAQIAAVAAQVGAFPLVAGSADSALYSVLNTGAYSLQIPDMQGATGTVLAEIYDANTAMPARLINVSARGQAGSGNSALIGGFVVTGSGTKTVLIRAIGPTLTSFGVPGAMADPRVDVYAAGASSPMAGNDNWGGSLALSQAFSQVNAFSLDPASKDAALVLTLAPGAYSAVVSGVNGSTGVALIEVYDVQ